MNQEKKQKAVRHLIYAKKGFDNIALTSHSSLIKNQAELESINAQWLINELDNWEKTNEIKNINELIIYLEKIIE